MSDNEWITYIMLNYIKRNKDDEEMAKKLRTTKSHFRKRNKQLGIKKTFKNKILARINYLRHKLMK